MYSSCSLCREMVLVDIAVMVIVAADAVLRLMMLQV